MTINTIIFDFGGVLVDWNPTHYYKDVFNDDEKMNWFLTNVCNNDWNLQQDKGRSFAEGASILKAEFPEYADHIDAYRANWECMLKDKIEGTVEILRSLKNNYKVYGLTNWSNETFPVALERFDFFQLFEGIVVSGDEKLIKPDKAIYHLLLDRYGIDPSTSVFIDDNLDNIKAAKEIGISGIHFKSPEDLKKQLELLNITV